MTETNYFCDEIFDVGLIYIKKRGGCVKRMGMYKSGNCSCDSCILGISYCFYCQEAMNRQDLGNLCEACHFHIWVLYLTQLQREFYFCLTKLRFIHIQDTDIQPRVEKSKVSCEFIFCPGLKYNRVSEFRYGLCEGCYLMTKQWSIENNVTCVTPRDDQLKLSTFIEYTRRFNRLLKKYSRARIKNN